MSSISSSQDNCSLFSSQDDCSQLSTSQTPSFDSQQEMGFAYTQNYSPTQLYCGQSQEAESPLLVSLTRAGPSTSSAVTSASQLPSLPAPRQPQMSPASASSSSRRPIAARGSSASTPMRESQPCASPAPASRSSASPPAFQPSASPAPASRSSASSAPAARSSASPPAFQPSASPAPASRSSASHPSSQPSASSSRSSVSSSDAVSQDNMNKRQSGEPRGVNWSAEERTELARAWKAASETYKGTDQSSGAFWEAVAKLLAENNPNEVARSAQQERNAPYRSTVAVERYFSRLSHKCSKWAACLLRAERANRSGTNRDDVVADAQDIYRQETWNKHHEEFDDHDAFEVLQSCPKWAKPQARPRSEDDDDEDLLQRPAGAKKLKSVEQGSSLTPFQKEVLKSNKEKVEAINELVMAMLIAYLPEQERLDAVRSKLGGGKE